MGDIPDISGAKLRLDRSMIPPDIADLIPLVEQWGFAKQEDQDSFVLMMRNHPFEILRFNSNVDKHRDEIIAWGKRLEARHQLDNVDSHPYWSFLEVLKIRELTEPDDSSKMQSARQRISNEVRMFNYNETALIAEELYRGEKYREYFELLSPYADLLNATQTTKLELAKKRM